jgi:hypothetical protein
LSLVLDAGALLAVEHRDDVVVRRLLDEADDSSETALTSAGVVAQIWRNGSRQARLARLLASIEIWPLGHTAARQVGELLAISRTRDIVDAHVALLVHDGDVVLTSDPRDIGRLLGSLGVAASVIKV